MILLGAHVGRHGCGHGVSVVRRKAGVEGQRGIEERRSARVATMTGIDKEQQTFSDGREFPIYLDLVATLLARWPWWPCR